MIKVVAALIKKDDKILIARRATGTEDVKGRWEFPGGKVEAGEDEFRAIEREIKEEFELNVKAKRFIINNEHQYPDKIVDLRLYECEYLSGEFRLHAHTEYLWVNKEDILKYELCPADIPLAKFILNN